MSKTSARRTRQQERLAEQRSSGRAFWIGVSVLVAVLGAVVIVGTTGGEPSVASKKAVQQRTGSASALDVVADAKTIALGHVPLNQTVTPTWKLTNNGEGTVALGEPHADVVEGCCPGPLQIGNASLGAGEATELTFPLQMHPGMDGPHGFSIHIPVERDGEKELLELTTTGHFSDQEV